YTSLLTLTFLLLGGIAYGLMAYSLARDVDYALKGVAEVMAEKARIEGSVFIPPDVDELFRRFFGFSPLDRQIELFDPRGQLESQQKNRKNGLDIPLSRKAIEAAAQGISTFETVQGDDIPSIRVLTVPVVRSGRVINLVRVGMSLDNMYKTQRRFLLIMAAVFPLGLLLAGGGGWLLARRALSPVDKMTQTAQRISGEHLSQRLQESGNGDELDRLAGTLNDMLGRLDDAINQMRQFSADASHELQTPLTILKGEMEVALLKPRSPEEYQAVLLSGLEEIDRINHLVSGLLLLARADAGVLRLDRQDVALVGLAEDVCGQMSVIAQARSIDLRLGDLLPVAVQGDREHLRRLLVNLVDNAIKYTGPGGLVSLTLKESAGWAVLEVADNGIGLTVEEQKKIFNRFHRASEARSSDGKGVGLGLSIALSIAEAHGGRIEVASTPGRGSTFSLYVPASSR
ncbi:MAG: HAMP domain-containing protein, partial [Desulfofustis sp.]|nr:HAMP domain-containing protein [Desulfofustis sp.]